MFENLFSSVLLVANVLLGRAPDTDQLPTLEAIALVANDEPPLFQGPDDRERTAALLASVAFRESAFRNAAVGDHGKSVCAFQILGGDASLLDDPIACARTAYRMLRTSIAVCRAYPVAWYAEGPKGCESSRAQRISRDRMALAEFAWKRAKLATDARGSM